MFARVTPPIRSWMLIYAGLFAAITMAGHPAEAYPEADASLDEKVVVIEAPLARRDI